MKTSERKGGDHANANAKYAYACLVNPCQRKVYVVYYITMDAVVQILRLLGRTRLPPRHNGAHALQMQRTVRTRRMHRLGSARTDSRNRAQRRRTPAPGRVVIDDHRLRLGNVVAVVVDGGEVLTLPFPRRHHERSKQLHMDCPGDSQQDLVQRVPRSKRDGLDFHCRHCRTAGVGDT